MNRLKNILLHNKWKGMILFLAIDIVLIGIMVYYPIIMGILIGYHLYVYKVHRKLCKELCYFTLIFIFLFEYNLIFLDSKIDQNITYIEGTVRTVPKIGEYNTSFYLKYHKELLLVKTTDDVKLGDYITMEGSVYEPSSFQTPGVFNYKRYLFNQNVYYIFTGTITNREQRKNLYTMRRRILDYIDTHYEGDSVYYMKSLILGDKSDFDDAVLNGINQIGISHLFAISGLHVGLIIVAIKKMMEQFKLSQRNQIIVISIFLLFYSFITGLSASVIRASLMIIGFLVTTYKKMKIDTIDLLSMIFILLIVYNPRYLYQVGFELSFLITLALLLSHHILEEKASILQQVMTISLIAYCMSLPITISINHQINLLTIFYNVVFVVAFTYVVIPSTFICLFIPILKPIYEELILILNKSILKLNSISIVTFDMKMNNMIIILGYYLLLIIILSNIEHKTIKFKHITIFILYFFFMWGNSYISPVYSVSFLDVGNGDSIVIQSPYQTCNVMIDSSKYDGNTVDIPFIKASGIHQIDVLVLTHSHADHINGSLDLIENGYVSNLVISYYEQDKLNNVIDMAQKYNIPVIPMKKGDAFTCGELVFHALGPNKDYYSPNNNSLVLYSKIGKDYYLFTGDMEKEAEYQLHIDGLPVGVLKIGHHGSDTSTSELFLNEIHPKYAVISVAKYNTYHHPSQSVLDRLQRHLIKVYITKNLGSIRFTYLLKYFRVISHG